MHTAESCVENFCIKSHFDKTIDVILDLEHIRLVVASNNIFPDITESKIENLNRTNRRKTFIRFGQTSLSNGTRPTNLETSRCFPSY